MPHTPESFGVASDDILSEDYGRAKICALLQDVLRARAFVAERALSWPA